MAKPKSLVLSDANKERETLEYIQFAIDNLRKRNAKFDYLHHLAKEVAEIVTLKRGSPLSYTTLTRNKAYKRKLLQYIGSTEKSKELSASEKKELEERLFDAKLTIGNLNAENERLRSYIAGLGRGDAELLPAPGDGEDYKEIAEGLAVIVSSFRDYFEEELEWDEKKKVIRDAGLGKVIVDGKPVSAFFEWMKEAKHIRGER